jgi:FeS assembly SUF system regulator
MGAMLRITRLTDYATVLLSHMAQAPKALFSSKKLAGDLGLGMATVSKILKLLAAHGLVSSVRGAEGGYMLAKPAAEIAITEIIEALEGPLAMTECALHQDACEQSSQCNLSTSWQSISHGIAEVLRQISLADMLGSKPSDILASITPEQLLATIPMESKL